MVSSAAMASAAGCAPEVDPPVDESRSGATGAGTGGQMGSGGASGSAAVTGGSAGTGGALPGSGGSGVGGAVGGTNAVGGSSAGGVGGTSAGSSAAGVGGGVAGSGAVSAGGTGDAGTGGSAAAGRGGTGMGGNVSAGSGGTNAGGSAGRPCVDTEPPPDPEWPDATCDSWANETTECSAAWFANYCDVSCGRCTPAGSGGAGGGGGAPGVDCSTQGLPNVSGGNGYTTRYWDCCQPHCAQFDNHRCGQDGVSSTGSNQSSCSGGGSFACYDEAPRAVSDCLSYGHIAKANPNCGSCYRIQFTGEGQYNANDPGSKLIKGKQMIVKVTNTGGDVGGSQFDLMIPGGGVGQFNACSNQWGTSDLGAQYGGFLTNCTGTHAQKKDCVRQNCMKIPAGKARDGCIWFVDWFQVADNPKFTSQSENCPF